MKVRFTRLALDDLERIHTYIAQFDPAAASRVVTRLVDRSLQLGTAGDTIDETMQNAVEVLAFAAEDWSDLDGQQFPQPRTIDELRDDPEFQQQVLDAIVAAVPFHETTEAAA